MRPRARALWVWLAVASLSLAPAVAVAHGAAPVSEPRAALDALPASLGALRVQLHHALAPQIVVENPTPTPLEILDERGRAFLRIAPEGVFADTSALAWHRTARPSDAGRLPADLVERELRGEPPPDARWRQLSRAPTWGWFDRRLLAAADPAHARDDSRASGEAGRWRIPVRWGGESSALSGGFRPEPPAPGFARVRLRSAAEPAPGLRVALIHGPVSALLVENRAAAPVVVLGAGGEPFLRIGPGGVEANVASETWREVALGRGLPDPSREAARIRGDVARWRLLSPAPRYAWIDPRTAALEGPAPAPDAAAAPAGFAIPLLAGGEELELRGVVEWQAVRSADATAR